MMCDLSMLLALHFVFLIFQKRQVCQNHFSYIWLIALFFYTFLLLLVTVYLVLENANFSSNTVVTTTGIFDQINSGPMDLCLGFLSSLSDRVYMWEIVLQWQAVQL